MYIWLVYWSYKCISTGSNLWNASDYWYWEFTGHRWITLTKAGDAEYWYLFWSEHEQTVNQTIRTLGFFRRHCDHYDVTVMTQVLYVIWCQRFLRWSITDFNRPYKVIIGIYEPFHENFLVATNIPAIKKNNIEPVECYSSRFCIMMVDSITLCATDWCYPQEANILEISNHDANFVQYVVLLTLHNCVTKKDHCIQTTREWRETYPVKLDKDIHITHITWGIYQERNVQICCVFLVVRYNGWTPLLINS